MKKSEGKDFKEGFFLPRTSSTELRGRQSVRATFRLSERAIHTISAISVHLGIKQKSLIDHLLEDTESLKLIAEEIQDDPFKPPNRVQKTFVISRKTLSCLERTSKNYDTPRDALVEYSIQRLLPLIAKERERHKKRKEIMKEMKEYLTQGQKILNKYRQALGEDDPICDMFESGLYGISAVYRDVESFVEKGKIIESF